MDYKGCCIWASDIPDEEHPHYIVVISSPDEDGLVLIALISSIKFKSDGRFAYDGQKCQYYDKSCLLEEGCITEHIPSKPSFVAYKWSEAVKADDLFQKQVLSVYKYKANISEDLLRKIQDGAKASGQIEERFEKYFELF